MQFIQDGKYEGKAPHLDLTIEAERREKLLSLIQAGVKIQSAHDLAEGGLGVALAESLFSSEELGAEVTLSGDATVALFSETQSRFLVTVKPEHRAALEDVFADAVKLGEVTADNQLTIMANNEMILQEDAAALKALWKGAIPCLLKSKA